MSIPADSRFITRVVLQNAPPNPEGIRGAKEWLSQQMEGSRRYSETIDQPALAGLFDLEIARRAPSFDKCVRDLERLLAG